MKERKHKPIFLSIPVIILVSVFSMFLLAPVSLIMTLVRIKKYPELRTRNIITLIISGFMVFIFIGILKTPSTSDTNKEEISENKEVIEETAKKEVKPIEKEVEEISEKEPEEEVVEETSIFGYPNQEKELIDAGYDIESIPSKECFLYSYAEYKIISDKTDMKDFATIKEEALNYVSDDDIADYVALETICYEYRGDNLANYIPNYLVPLVGDEWQDVADKACIEYFGYSVFSDSEQEEVISNNITIDYIDSLESTSINAVVDMGNKSKEELYSIAESVVNNSSNIQYDDFSIDIIRDPNNVGKGYKMNMHVNDSFSNSSMIAVYSDEFMNGILDTSLFDTKLFTGDNISVTCIYLGLSEFNYPVFLATSVTLY